jgi:HK97 gp10 family phage protein
MITAKWKGVRSLNKKLDKINNTFVNSTKIGVDKALEDIQKLALDYKVGKKDPTQLPFESDINGSEINGRLHSDKDTFNYAGFLEFGTGAFAEKPHVGTTKTFIDSGFTMWYLPVEKVNKPLPYKIITIKGKRFYVVFGQKPKPFMRPAAFESRDNTLEQIQKEMIKNIEKVIK